MEDIPDELVVQFPQETPLVATWLTQQRKTRYPNSRKVSMACPQKGSRKELLAMAIQNAEEALEQFRQMDVQQMQNDPSRALMALQETLALPNYPSRMECYDISHIQGSHTVASMVVFKDGRPDKSAYKRFKLQSTAGKPDDFKSMADVMTRRFKHSSLYVRGEKERGDKKDLWDDPDLIIIDGGKGQLNAAMKALHTLGIRHQPMISLAKRFEEVYLSGQSQPYRLPGESTALHMLQQIRDEAHRFALSYHRTLRQHHAKQSLLDQVPGIGPKRKRCLLEQFGTLDALRAASVDDLTGKGHLPMVLAKRLYTFLQEHPQ